MPRQYTSHYKQRKLTGFYTKKSRKGKKQVIPITAKTVRKKPKRTVSTRIEPKPVIVKTVIIQQPPPQPEPTPEPQVTQRKRRRKTLQDKAIEAHLKRNRTPKKMTHLERMHLLAFAKQFEIDPQEVDNSLTYSENKQHLIEIAEMQGASSYELGTVEQEMGEWASQYESYLNQLKGELELAGYEVAIPA